MEQKIVASVVVVVIVVAVAVAMVEAAVVWPVAPLVVLVAVAPAVAAAAVLGLGQLVVAVEQIVLLVVEFVVGRLAVALADAQLAELLALLVDSIIAH